MIEDRTRVQPGTVLRATFKKAEHGALVMEDGRILRQMEIGDATPITDRVYPSLSAAAMAITGSSTNGWRFWSISMQDAQPDGPKDENGVIHAEEPGPAPTPAVVHLGSRNFRKAPNQLGMEPGMTRWWCMGCQKGFKRQGPEYPVACDEGHPGHEIHQEVA